eukprot:SAG31_NODE_1462_length_8242_cov_5.541135_3_plen_74_part_00
MLLVTPVSQYIRDIAGQRARWPASLRAPSGGSAPPKTNRSSPSAPATATDRLRPGAGGLRNAVRAVLPATVVA